MTSFVENANEFAGLGTQLFNFGNIGVQFLQDEQPIFAFRSFLGDYGDLMHEVCRRFRSVCLSVISTNRCRRA